MSRPSNQTEPFDSGRSPDEKLRNLCLLELLYATGMRVTELVSLPVQAVRGDPAMILVRGKGEKERMVPLSRPARAATTMNTRPIPPIRPGMGW